MNTEEIFKQSGYTIPSDKHDECSKRFDYWDMIAFADLVIEKQQSTDSNLSQHFVSFSLPTTEEMEDQSYVIGKEYKGDYPDVLEEGFEMCYDWIKKSNES